MPRKTTNNETAKIVTMPQKSDHVPMPDYEPQRTGAIALQWEVAGPEHVDQRSCSPNPYSRGVPVLDSILISNRYGISAVDVRDPMGSTLQIYYIWADRNGVQNRANLTIEDLQLFIQNRWRMCVEYSENLVLRDDEMPPGIVSPKPLNKHAQRRAREFGDWLNTTLEQPGTLSSRAVSLISQHVFNTLLPEPPSDAGRALLAVRGLMEDLDVPQHAAENILNYVRANLLKPRRKSTPARRVRKVGAKTA